MGPDQGAFYRLKSPGSYVQGNFADIDPGIVQTSEQLRREVQSSRRGGHRSLYTGVDRLIILQIRLL